MFLKVTVFFIRNQPLGVTGRRDLSATARISVAPNHSLSNMSTLNPSLGTTQMRSLSTTRENTLKSNHGYRY